MVDGRFPATNHTHPDRPAQVATVRGDNRASHVLSRDREALQAGGVATAPTSVPDRELAGLARKQGGFVLTAQALAAGLSPAAIGRRVAARRWFVVVRGVYAVGSEPSSHVATCRAALLAVPGSVVSHRSAAFCWGMLERPPALPELTAPHGSADVRRAGMTVHRSRRLTTDDCRRHRGLRVTRPSRTALDLCDTASFDEAVAAIRAAERSGLLAVGSLRERIDRGALAGRRSAPRAEQVVTFLERGTKSWLEDRMPAVVAAAGLPPAVPQFRVDDDEGRPRYFDFGWPIGLVAELDSHEHHAKRPDRQRDIDKGNLAVARGLTLLRFSYEDVTQRPDESAARLAEVWARLVARR